MSPKPMRCSVSTLFAALSRVTCLRGHKIGLTSAPMQQLLGVSEPDFGYILDSMVLPDGAAVPVTAFCAPRVEPEVAFLLRSPLHGPNVTVDDVLAATEAVAAALEVVDSRIANWRITLADTIADNASSGAVVLGEWVPIGDVPPLSETTATLVVNDRVVGTGRGNRRARRSCRSRCLVGQRAGRLRHRHRGRPVRDVRLVHHGVVCRRGRPCVGNDQRNRFRHRDFRIRIEGQNNE